MFQISRETHFKYTSKHFYNSIFKQRNAPRDTREKTKRSCNAYEFSHGVYMGTQIYYLRITTPFARPGALNQGLLFSGLLRIKISRYTCIICMLVKFRTTFLQEYRGDER